MPRLPTGVYEQPFPDVMSATTIDSTVYNGFVNDVETDLNVARPIVAGGTGATSASAARDNLDVEVAGAQVTNYDSHVFENGSFWSNPTATGAPTAQWFGGIAVLVNNDPGSLLINGRDLNSGLVYYRKKNGGVWGAWVSDKSISDPDYVNITGDTMTGHLTLALASPAIILNQTGAADDTADLRFARSGANRWLLRQGSDADNNNLRVYALDAGGSPVGAALDISRSTALVSVFGNPTAAMGIATKSYVDTTAVTMTGDTMTGALYAPTVGASPSGYPQLRDLTAERHLDFASDEYFAYNSSTAEIVAYNSSTGLMIKMRPGDLAFFAGGAAYKPAGGVWADSSDERIKNVLGNYDNGLDAVLQLQPVRFTYKGNDTPAEVAPSNDVAPQYDESGKLKQSKDAVAVPYANSLHGSQARDGTEFIGLIAQAVEGHMPEMVTQHAATIDGAPVTDMRVLDTTPLLFALVNAVKTLAARVEALEAAQAP